MLRYKETNWKYENGFDTHKYDLTLNVIWTSKTRKEQQAKIGRVLPLTDIWIKENSPRMGSGSERRERILPKHILAKDILCYKNVNYFQIYTLSKCQ